jgi:hypothetical protein
VQDETRVAAASREGEVELEELVRRGSDYVCPSPIERAEIPAKQVLV